MLIDERSHGLWRRTAPDPPPTATLRDEITADIVVIGAGFTGCSAALHLAERGADVVVLEAGQIGSGASGRNVGLVNAGMWTMPRTVEETLGPIYGPRLLTLLGEAPRLVFEIVRQHGIACEAEPVGTLHCAVGEAGLREITARAEQWQALGAPVRLLDQEEAARQTGTRAYRGALLDERAGTIQPLAYVRGLAAAAIRTGARMFTGSPARSAARRDGAWQVAAGGGSVRARWLVMATDVYTAELFPQLRTEQVALPYFNIATAPLGGNLRGSILPDRQGAWDTRSVLSHFRLDAAGRLIVGSVGALRGTGRAVHRAWARRHIRALFPHLGDVPFEAEWYGRIGMTDDNLPRLHVLGEQALAVGGYNGRGIAPGTTFGRELARHIADGVVLEDLALPVTALRDARLRRTREALYEVGSQLAHLPHP